MPISHTPKEAGSALFFVPVTSLEAPLSAPGLRYTPSGVAGLRALGYAQRTKFGTRFAALSATNELPHCTAVDHFSSLQSTLVRKLGAPSHAIFNPNPPRSSSTWPRARHLILIKATSFGILQRLQGAPLPAMSHSTPDGLAGLEGSKSSLSVMDFLLCGPLLTWNWGRILARGLLCRQDVDSGEGSASCIKSTHLGRGGQLVFPTPRVARGQIYAPYS